MGQAKLQEATDKILFLSFEGEINEKFNWPEITNLNFLSIKVDLSKATAINSLGILHWMRWWNQVLKEKTIEAIDFQFAKPFFLNCASIVKGFLPEGAVIQSFYIEYGDDSGETELKFFERNSQDQSGTLEIPGKILVQRNQQEIELDLTCIPSTTFRSLNFKVKVV